MKQVIKKTTVIAMGLFTLSAMGFAQADFADLKSDNPVEFKFIGKTKSQPVFQLRLNDAEKYFVTIKDESSNVLYSERILVKEANFSKKYRLDIQEDEISAPGFGITVEVTSAKTHETRVFKVSSKTVTTENIVVAQL